MPPKAVKRPSPRQRLVGLQVPAGVLDPAVNRALTPTFAAVQRLEEQLRPRSYVVADLLVGTNRISHQLGKRPRHCHITPTTASASFAYALVDADDLVATIDVIGFDQIGAGIEFI